MVRCSDNSLYCGITKDIDRRLHEHNNTKKSAKYTRSRRPVVLAWFEKAESQSCALKREAVIKKMTKTQKENLCKEVPC